MLPSLRNLFHGRVVSDRPRWALSLVFGLALGLASGSAAAQANPTATREPVQVGGTFSFGSPDYTESYVKGFTAYGDVSLARRLSFEAEYHDLDLLKPDNIGLSSLLFGGRYAFSLEDRATLYAKALGGVGRFTYAAPRPDPHTDSYGIAAAGGGVEFRAAHHINVRAIDLEYQIWPGFQPHGLNPWVASMGAGYVF